VIRAVKAEAHAQDSHLDYSDEIRNSQRNKARCDYPSSLRLYSYASFESSSTQSSLLPRNLAEHNIKIDLGFWHMISLRDGSLLGEKTGILALELVELLVEKDFVFIKGAMFRRV